MESAALVLVLVAVAIGLLKMHFDARRDRREAIGRLAEEGIFSGASPTERLFREEGVPVPDAMRDGLVSPISVPEKDLRRAGALRPAEADGTPPTVDEPVTPTPVAGELDGALQGVRLPCGLAPLTGVPTGAAGRVANFVTDVARRAELHDALDAELRRMGMEVVWTDPTTALARGGRGAVMVRVHELPDPAAFPTAPANSVVVQLTAV